MERIAERSAIDEDEDLAAFGVKRSRVGGYREIGRDSFECSECGGGERLRRRGGAEELLENELEAACEGAETPRVVEVEPRLVVPGGAELRERLLDRVNRG